jgi:hypothetical protein
MHKQEHEGGCFALLDVLNSALSSGETGGRFNHLRKTTNKRRTAWETHPSPHVPLRPTLTGARRDWLARLVCTVLSFERLAVLVLRFMREVTHKAFHPCSFNAAAANNRLIKVARSAFGCRWLLGCLGCDCLQLYTVQLAFAPDQSVGRLRHKLPSLLRTKECASSCGINSPCRESCNIDKPTF